MSKQLIIIRHGDALPKEFGRSDFDRNLSDIGKKEAQKMAFFLKSKEIKPDYLLVSAAKRTQQTAQFFIDSFYLEEKQFLFQKELYNAFKEDIISQISSMPDEILGHTLFLIGHNPSLSELAQSCIPSHPSLYLPTCGVVVIDLPISTWSNFSINTTGSLVLTQIPNNI